MKSPSSSRPPVGPVNPLRVLHLQRAQLFLDAGDLDVAEALYRGITDDITADLALAEIGRRRGHPALCCAAAERALCRDPARGDGEAYRGLALKLLSRLDAAATSLTRARRLGPDRLWSTIHLAEIRLLQGQSEAARTLLRAALVQWPAHPDLLLQAAQAEAASGAPGPAATGYRRAARLGVVQAWRLLGDILLAQRHGGPAVIAVFRTGLRFRPDDAGCWNNLAIAARTSSPDQARTAVRRALRIDPGQAQFHIPLSNLLYDQGRSDDAIAMLRRALTLAPDQTDAWFNLARLSVGQIPAGIALARRLYRRVLTLAPDHARARYNDAILALMTGDFAAGWAGYEARHHVPELGCPPRPFVQPRWHGEPCPGGTLLLHTEQGLGDTIQFLRFVPTVAALWQSWGGHVVVEVQPTLWRLTAVLSEVATVVVTGDPLPDFDRTLPLMSVPSVIGTTIPAQVPYLTVPDLVTRHWQERLADWPRPRVGIAWRGNPGHGNDHERSIVPFALAPLLLLPYRLLSLQQPMPGPPPLGDRLLPIFEAGHDMADCAATIQMLDLVISVDTAIGHLAGALGAPVWLLLPPSSDWRWQLDRADTPWYPTMRLIRRRPGQDWAEVLALLLPDLYKLAPY
ncbi:MAG: tetratricopeptide repeat protein [Azospirillaceae bacterium]|nr:tetratricopeptide repeat protein [Azospirillaceae bacterium]